MRTVDSENSVQPKDIVYRQHQPYGCALYAICNVLSEVTDSNRLRRFLTNERIEQSKNGLWMIELNRYLSEDGFDFFIDTIYQNMMDKKLPDSVIELNISPEGHQFPFLMDCKAGINQERGHMIGGILHHDKTVELFDSLREYTIVTTLADVNNIYAEAYGIHCFHFYSYPRERLSFVQK